MLASAFLRAASSAATGAAAASTAATGTLYPSHVPTSTLQKAYLAVTSAFGALNDPYRGDLVATLGDTTGMLALPSIRDRMLSSPTGRRILRERPTISSSTIDLKRLATLPDGTFGREYIRFLDDQQVTPDTRTPVKYVDDEELAYILRRYRETHDFYHTITGFSVTVEAELALKWFEMAQTGLPVATLSALFGPLGLSSEERTRLFDKYVPWALACGSQTKHFMSIMWEDHWDKPLDQLREELGYYFPPHLERL
ncbi:coenzyme Q biosynthesis Coq4 [Ramicandelaber brevisporus]|nr:coenzyme Q biosynthesis Coq4 [Ramicandelaber brevisporus]